MINEAFIGECLNSSYKYDIWFNNISGRDTAISDFVNLA